MKLTIELVYMGAGAPMCHYGIVPAVFVTTKIWDLSLGPYKY